MALFGKKKKDATPAAPQAAKIAASPGASAHVASMLKNPRITEKATMHQAASVYTFDVDPRATKRDIIAAVRAVYQVTPRKVAVITVPSKTRRSMKTGRIGASKGGRKAYVYLAKGETITIA